MRVIYQWIRSFFFLFLVTPLQDSPRLRACNDSQIEGAPVVMMRSVYIQYIESVYHSLLSSTYELSPVHDQLNDDFFLGLPVFQTLVLPFSCQLAFNSSKQHNFSFYLLLGLFFLLCERLWVLRWNPEPYVNPIYVMVAPFKFPYPSKLSLGETFPKRSPSYL